MVAITSWIILEINSALILRIPRGESSNGGMKDILPRKKKGVKNTSAGFDEYEATRATACVGLLGLHCERGNVA